MDINLILGVLCVIALLWVLKKGFKLLKIGLIIGLCWFVYQTFGLLAVPALLLLLWAIKQGIKLLKIGMVIALIIFGLNYLGVLSLIGISF